MEELFYFTGLNPVTRQMRDILVVPVEQDVQGRLIHDPIVHLL